MLACPRHAAIEIRCIATMKGGLNLEGFKSPGDVVADPCH
jgi:hypothetical protein